MRFSLVLGVLDLVSQKNKHINILTSCKDFIFYHDYFFLGKVRQHEVG